MQTRTIFYSFGALCLMLGLRVSAQAPMPLPSMFSYLTAQEGTALTLELDLTDLINHKNTNQYFPGTLTTSDGKVFAMEARARGKYRRKICDMPPLKLKFPKKPLRAHGLDTFNEIKLVVPCLDDPKGEELVLREYVAYKMFQRISPQYHVRAGLVKVTFRDRHVEKDRAAVWCLMIEHEEEVTARLNGDLLESYNLPIDSFQTEQVADHAMFQYLIGNTDWSLSTFRNVYLFKPKGGQGLMRVLPYDFDFAGLVDAPYATPTTQTGLKGVKERLLMSDGLSQATINGATARLHAMKSDLLDMCTRAGLGKGDVRDLSRYVESFFSAGVPQVEGVRGGRNLR